MFRRSRSSRVSKHTWTRPEHKNPTRINTRVSIYSTRTRFGSTRVFLKIILILKIGQLFSSNKIFFLQINSIFNNHILVYLLFESHLEFLFYTLCGLFRPFFLYYKQVSNKAAKNFKLNYQITWLFDQLELNSDSTSRIKFELVHFKQSTRLDLKFKSSQITRVDSIG